VLISTEAITKVATQILFVSPQIAHSYAHSAISNPQISEVFQSANFSGVPIRKFVMINPQIRTFSLCPSPQIRKFERKKAVKASLYVPK
jgi:hypothetical protein